MGLVAGAIPTFKFDDHQNGITFESNGGVTPGLKVLSVDEFSLGQRNGLETGDVVLKVGRTRVSSETDLRNAFNSIPLTTLSVRLSILNVRTGASQPMTYELTTEAGSYQTNFGRVDLVQTPTNTPGVSLLEGTLHFYSGAIAEIKGTLSGNSFRGNSTSPLRGAAPFELTLNGSMFEGHVTQGRKRRFVFVNEIEHR